jgi:hypothetical protein
MDWLANLLFDPGLLSNDEVQSEIAALIESDPAISDLRQSTKVRARIGNCPDGVRSFYDVRKHEIIISSNGFTRDSLREALFHEYVHANDHLNRGIDLSTLRGLAISEVHAMTQCECRDSWFQRACVFANAVRAVALSIKDEQKAREVVNLVFNEAYEIDDPDPTPAWYYELLGGFD